MKKIFYSWQSDTPREIGKDLIRDALDDAVAQVSADLDLQEAERPEVDQDTQGTLGAPAIAETILAKIEAADLVVVDVTLTGRVTVGGTIGEKAFINSNVAIELGAALGSHGDEVLLQVMNTHFGSKDYLPFDLRHRRFPTAFDLAPGADKAAREKARRNLAKTFAEILALYIKAKSPPAPVFERTSCNANPAVYWKEGEVLVDRRGAQLTAPTNLPMVYLRLSPTEPIPPFSGVQIADFSLTQVRPLISEAAGHSPCRNDHGMIYFVKKEAEDDELPDLLVWSQVFRNREIWGVNVLQLHSSSSSQRRISMNYLERDLIDGLQEYLRRADSFGYGPLVQFEAGLTYVRGYRLSFTGSRKMTPDPLRVDFITHSQRFDRRDPEAWKAPLLALFEKIFDEGAEARPTNLNDFPSKR
jgi:hypothetical protein